MKKPLIDCALVYTCRRPALARQNLTLGVEPVLHVAAVFAAALFEDLKGPVSDPVW